MELKVGVKQKNIGFIPENWVVYDLGEIISYVKGYAFKSSNYKKDGARVIRVSDLTSNKISDENAVYIDESLRFQYKKWRLNENDLIITTVGSKPPIWESLVGKVIKVDKKHKAALLNQNAVLLREKNNNQNIQNLIFYNLGSERYIHHIEEIFRGNANQASITLVELFKFQIALPSLKTEQRAIAEALSDVDAFIAAQEALIAKKRAIKQGVMQELLTGKRRLPGFRNEDKYKLTKLGLLPGDWTTTTIGEQCSSFSGGTPKTSNPNFYGGDIPWITSADLNSTRIRNVKGRITIQGVENSSTKFIKKGTILLALYGATAGVSAISEINATINQAVLAIIPNKMNSEYIFYFLQYYKNYFIKKFTQGGQPNFSGEIVRSFCIPQPPTKNEQTAISKVLIDCDEELSLLEQKLKKLQLVKQGMMQELLTGRIRLTGE